MFIKDMIIFQLSRDFIKIKITGKSHSFFRAFEFRHWIFTDKLINSHSYNDFLIF